jgi:uncharacterized protein (TIGR00369 family)
MNAADLQTRCARVPFFRFLDFSVTEMTNDCVVASMPFAERHIGNPVLDTYHGGIISSFMEAAASLCLFDDWEQKRLKPINLSVDFLRPSLPGKTLNARAVISRRGRRTASIEAIAWQEDVAKPVAAGRFHFLLV